MEYLLKSAIISAIVYLFYKVFLQKETFFQSIRIYFIIGIVAAILLPLVIIPIYIEVPSAIVPEALTKIPITENFIKAEINVDPIEIKEAFNWLALIGSVYIIGVVVLIIKFLIDLISLLSLLFYGIKTRTKKYIFVEIKKEISPFSFFKFIVYNKNRFTKTELKDIIAHEKVHIQQNHSLDILLIQIATIVQWYNPFIWLYKKELQQNLEYIADKEAQEKAETHKKYQYLLLKTSIKNNPFALSNNFFNSHLKKRIMMLQKSQTKRLNQIKYLLIIPLLTLFLYAFNTKEIIQYNKKENISKKEGNSKNIGEEQIFINPIIKYNVIEITSNFGKRINPLTNKIKFHNGIDIRAYKNMDVYATAYGKVIKAEYNELKGNYIQIQHANNYQTNYHHLGNIQVGVGDKVEIGEIIGIVGNTGRSTGIHLHYEIIKDGKNIDPSPYVKYSKSLKIIIKSKTTDKRFSKIEKRFKKESNVELKFYEIKRNENNEITAIKVDGKTKGTESSFSFSQDYPISKIIIAYDKDKNEIFIENKDLKQHRKKTSNQKTGTILSTTSSSSHSEKTIVVNNTPRPRTVKYVGKTYYYTKSKRHNIFCGVNYNDEMKSKLSKEDIARAKKITKEGKDYMFYENVVEITFFDRYGNDVDTKLAKQLMKVLKKKQN